MAIETELRTLIINTVGDYVDDVYMSVVPIGAVLPCITYNYQSETIDHTKDKMNTSNARIDLNIYVKDPATVSSVDYTAAELIETIADTLLYELKKHIPASGLIQELRLDSQSDDWDEPLEAYVTRQEYIIRHKLS